MSITNHKAFASFESVDFRFFIGFRFFITIAIQAQALIGSWWMYQLTGSPVSLGLIGLVEAIPALSIALFAGYWADIWDRKKIILTALVGFIIGTIVLLLLGLSAGVSNEVKIVGIYVVIFLTGVFRGTMAPANSAIISQLVPHENFANAATWNSWCWQTSSVLGPVISGLLYNRVGLSTLLIVVLVLIILSFLSMLRVNPRRVTSHVKREPIVPSLKGGVSYVFKNDVILGALSLDMFAVLFGGAVALLPIYANEILNVGAEGLGYLRAAPGLGSVITMFFLAFFPPLKNSGRTLLISVFGFGVSTILFAVSKNWQWSLVWLFFTGAFDSVSVVIRGAILQLYTPNEMRGRVSSVNTIFIGSSNELGAFESGMAAKLMGTEASVVFGGCMTLLITVWAWWRFKILRTLSIGEKQK